MKITLFLLLFVSFQAYCENGYSQNAKKDENCYRLHSTSTITKESSAVLMTAANYADAFEAKYDMPALVTVTPKWDEGAANEAELERIITQKWIACYPDGYEAWTEQPRTICRFKRCVGRSR